jgi:hypothetical protein
MDPAVVLETIAFGDALPPRGDGEAVFVTDLAVRAGFPVSLVLLVFLSGTAADAALV